MLDPYRLLSSPDMAEEEQRQATPEELIEGHLGLVARIARRMRRPGVTFADWFGAGAAGLTVAANRWQWAGKPFRLYARPYIRRAMRDLAEEALPYAGGPTGPSLAQQETPEDSLGVLTPVEREIVENVLLAQPREPLKKCAARLSLSLSEGRDLLAAAIERLRKNCD
jgi:hypothetical protein